ncbi:hypothetical protein [Comamonas terrigena]|uniref:hypothetical protein n=1 Tax=Comamonas terrigena TaxID=32013 RepID=UPI00289B8936|nr:hypothetical protein [Comamonas terrigena]
MNFDSWSLRDKIIIIWALSIATTAILFVCVSLGNLLSDNSSTIASWAQAIVSAGAIIAGALGLNWQMREAHRLQLKKEEESDRRGLRRGYLIVAYRFAELKSFSDTTIKRYNLWEDDWNNMKMRFLQVKDEIQKINLSDLPNPDWITQLITVNFYFNDIQNSLDIEFKDLEVDKILHLKKTFEELNSLSENQYRYAYSRSLILSTDGELEQTKLELNAMRKFKNDGSGETTTTGNQRTTA